MILLDKFFRSNVLSWIEAVAAKGTLSPLILSAKNLRGFLESREKHRGPIGKHFQLAANWSTDLGRIAAKFGRNLLESPTSIYWLIPSFCPLESPIKVQFGSSHGGVSVTGLSNTVWNDRLACKNYGSEQAVSTACSDKHFAVGLSSGIIHLYFQDTCQEARVLKILQNSWRLTHLGTCSFVLELETFDYGIQRTVQRFGARHYQSHQLRSYSQTATPW
jgi:hypothetical protein